MASLEKGAKNKEKIQAKVDRERAMMLEIEKERNEIEERLYSTKPLDELNEREKELKRQNDEDQKIIEDENATPSEILGAEDRIDERNEELGRLQSQIGERERALSLLERVREIFKRNGLTFTAIFLAAVSTIASVIGAIISASKKVGTDLANVVKNAGANAPPGLIGSIVSFLFKAAGSALGFLTEHTWLLILAVVAFLFQKLR